MIYKRGEIKIDAKKDLKKCEVDDVVEFENIEEFEYWSSILGIRNDWKKIKKMTYQYRPIIHIKTKSYQYCDICHYEIDIYKQHYQCKWEHDMCEECFEKANTFKHKEEYLGQALELLNYYKTVKDNDHDDEMGEDDNPEIPTNILEKIKLLESRDHYDLWLLFIIRGKEIIKKTEKAIASANEEKMDRIIWELNYDDEAFCQDGMSPCLCPVCRGEVKEKNDL